MRVTFVGVGEAFDETLANVSLLLEQGGQGLLLDCGPTAAPAFWRLAESPLDLDGVVISHFHGDHFLGLAALLLRFVEEGRKRDLHVAGQAGVGEKVNGLMELAYPGLLAKRDFTIHYMESGPGASFRVAGFELAFALGDHSIPSLAVRVNAGSRSVFYSGDGRPTAATLELARGVDLLVQEAFRLAPDTPGHGTVEGAIGFAREAGAGMLALVHVNRAERAARLGEITARMAQETGFDVLLPEPEQAVTL